MKHPKFLVEVFTKTSMRFLEKNAPGVEVFIKTYLKFFIKTYFMKQGSPIVRSCSYFNLLTKVFKEK